MAATRDEGSVGVESVTEAQCPPGRDGATGRPAGLPANLVILRMEILAVPEPISGPFHVRAAPSSPG